MNSLDIKELEFDLAREPVVVGSAAHSLGSSVVDYRDTRYMAGNYPVIFSIINSFAIQPYAIEAVYRDRISFFFIRNGSVNLDVAGNVKSVGSPVVLITKSSTEQTRYLRMASVITNFVGVHISPDVLSDVYGLRFERARKPFNYLAGPVNRLVELRAVLSPKCGLIVEDIANCSLPQPMQGVFIRSKIDELMCLTVSAIMENRSGKYAISSIKPDGSATLDAAARIYREHFGSLLSVEDVAKRLGVHRNVLSASFKERFGVSPSEYGRMARLEWAREQILGCRMPLKRVASLCGYATSAAFSRAYLEHFGSSPSSDANN